MCLPIEEIVALIVDEGKRFDAREHRRDAHRDHIGAVYIAVIEALEGKADVHTPEAFVRTVARREYRRECRRDREQAVHHTPIRDNSDLESGTRTWSGGRVTSPEPLDELIRQETCRTLDPVAELLAKDAVNPLRCLTSGALGGLIRDYCTRSDRVSVRTRQRRRQRLLARLRHQLER